MSLSLCKVTLRCCSSNDFQTNIVFTSLSVVLSRVDIVLPDRDYWHLLLLLLLLCLLTLTSAFLYAHRRRIYFAQFVNIACRYLAQTSAVSFWSVCQASALTMNHELALASIAALLLIQHSNTSWHPWILGHNNRDDYRIQWSVCGLLSQLQRCWKEHRAQTDTVQL